jgi:hypothetical protein
MKVTKSERLLPPAPCSSADTADPDELKNDLEKYEHLEELAKLFFRGETAPPLGARQRIRLIWRGRSGPISRVIYTKTWRRAAARFESLQTSGTRGACEIDSPNRKICLTERLILIRTQNMKSAALFVIVAFNNHVATLLSRPHGIDFC